MTKKRAKTVMMRMAPQTTMHRKSIRIQILNTLTTLSILQPRVRYLSERLKLRRKRAQLQSLLELIRLIVVQISLKILTNGASAEVEAL